MNIVNDAYGLIGSHVHRSSVHSVPFWEQIVWQETLVPRGSITHTICRSYHLLRRPTYIISMQLSSLLFLMIHI